ncbi:MAG: hypothetical protein B9S32_16365 [Verrucomicrobia bacterium Tous-C9LFEB]|nr:MAG: hypothetical protein B9S32_16365 [Verrucomicrobia bacterium Tous-C9LFEB]
MPTMLSESAWSAQELAAIEELQKKVSATRRTLGLSTTPVSSTEQETEFLRLWNELLPQVQAVSLTLWDTALQRTCLQPDDRFLFLKTFPPFTDLPLSREQIYALRIQAEEAARQAGRQQTGSTEITLDEIYERLGREAGLTPPQISDCIQAEHKLECLLARPLVPILQLVQSAHAQNKTILILADTVLGKNHLLELLLHAGYPLTADTLFTTAECRTSLANGSLLRKAAKALSIPTHQILHLGHDPEADATAARLAEAPCLLHPYSTSNSPSAQHQSLDVRHAESLLRGTARTLTFPPSLPPDDQSFWLQLGALSVGPMLTCFTMWLASQWQRQHIQHAYFLGRSGQLLHQLYQILQQHHPELPPAEHLHASRRAYLLPTLGCQYSPDLPTLFMGHGACPVAELLAQLDLDPTLFATAITKAGFHSPETPIDPRQNPVRLQRLFRDPDLLGALTERAQGEREILLRYLQQQRLTTDCPTALVDLGWNNTATKSLLSILHHEEIHHNLTGFHLLTLPGAQAPQLVDYRYHSYLSHNGEPLSLSQTLSAGRALLYTLCAADHPPVRYFTHLHNSIKPLYNPLPPDPEQTAQLNTLHQGIFAYAHAIFHSPLHTTLLDTPPEIATAEFARLAITPTPEEARKLGALHYLNGAPRPRPLALFSHDTLSPQELLSTYQQADWKPGLLHQHTPQSWLLRQLVEQEI